PFVVRGLRIEAAAYEQSHGCPGLGARRGVVHEYPVAHPDDIRRPGIVAAAGEHIRTRLASRHSGHQRATAPPLPAVGGLQEGQTRAGAERIEVTVVLEDGGGIVHAWLPVERQRWHREERGCGD